MNTSENRLPPRSFYIPGGVSEYNLLNGEWDFEIDHSVSGLDKGFQQRKSLDSKITVPFCPESKLSGLAHTDFMEAVYKACTDEQGFKFETEKEFTVGVAADSFDDGSSNATAEADGVVKMYTDFAGSVIVEGKIVASINDAIQPNVKFNTAGEITTKEYKGTKRELKEGYGMAGNQWSSDNNGDGVILEWDAQAKAFEAYVVGKTAQEVKDMPTKTLENGYVISSEDALLKAGCTIQITAIKAVVAKSVSSAR